jgi:hypothetical protein
MKNSAAVEGAQEVGAIFVGNCSVQTDQLDENVKQMWNLETLGIVEDHEIHDEFVENIKFNGN